MFFFDERSVTGLTFSTGAFLTDFSCSIANTSKILVQIKFIRTNLLGNDGKSNSVGCSNDRDQRPEVKLLAGNNLNGVRLPFQSVK